MAGQEAKTPVARNEEYFAHKFRVDERLEDEARERGEKAAQLGGTLAAAILLRATPTKIEPLTGFFVSGTISSYAHYISKRVEIDGISYSLAGDLYLSETSADKVSLDSVREGTVSVIKHVPGKDEVKYNFQLNRFSPSDDISSTLRLGKGNEVYLGPTFPSYPDERIKAKDLIKEMDKKVPARRPTRRRTRPT